MKYRNDFVTNSSSSSFVIAYRNSNEMVKDFTRYAKLCADMDEWEIKQYNTVIFDIFKNKVSFTRIQAIVKKILQDEAFYKYGNYTSGLTKYGGNYALWKNSKEYKDLCNNYVKKGMNKFLKEYNEKGFFSFLSYRESEGYYDLSQELKKMLNGCIFTAKDD